MEVNAVNVAQRGLIGDRVYALTDAANGKVVSAKNPKKWPKMFDFRAAFTEPPQSGQPIPPVRIMLPDGTIVTSEQSDLEDVLSGVLDRQVRLQATAPKTSNLEEYWPDMDDLDHRDTVTEESMPSETFFDFAAVHVLTIATLD